MKLNQAGLDLIKSFEGCYLTVYKDLVGLNTVGYGHRTSLPVGSPITQQEADTLLENDLSYTARFLQQVIKNNLNDDQFSACVSLAFNVGITAFNKSTLLKLINSNNLVDAASEFIKWDRAGGVQVPGLLRRREAEKALFSGEE